MEEMYRECYEYAVSVNYSLLKMREVAKKYNICEETALRYAMIYYVYFLGYSYEEWVELQDIARDERRIEVDNNRLERYVLSIDSRRELYEMLGRGTYDDYKAKLPKYCYDFCESVLFDMESVKERALELEMSYYDFRGYAKDYALYVLGHDKFQLVGNKNNIPDDIKNKRLLSSWISYSKKRKRCYDFLGGGTYDEFKSKLIEQTFIYAKGVKFDKEMMTRYGKMYDIGYPSIRRYVIAYAKNILKMNYDEISDMLDSASREKLINNKLVKWIGNSFRRRKIYEDLGSKSYDEFMLSLKKNCYEYAKSVSFDDDMIGLYAERIGISYSTIKNYSRDYMINVLNDSDVKSKNIYGYHHGDKSLELWVNNSYLHREIYDKLNQGDYVTFRRKLEEFCYLNVVLGNYNYFMVCDFSLRWDISIRKIIIYIMNYGRNNYESREEIDLWMDKFKRDMAKQVVNEEKMGLILRKLELGNDIDFNDIDIDNLYYYIASYVDISYGTDMVKKELVMNELRGKINNYIFNNRVKKFVKRIG